MCHDQHRHIELTDVIRSAVQKFCLLFCDPELPVGSSAIINSGLATNARANATR